MNVWHIVARWLIFKKMSCCIRCEKKLSFNDIGAHKKFINRGSAEFMCIACVAKELEVPESLLYEKIEFLKEHGCTLFV